MTQIISITQKSQTKGWTLILSNLFSEPLVTLYSFLTFILYKDLGATLFAVTLLTMFKPLSTILSFYWSAGLKGRGERRLKANMIWAGIWMRLPFLFCPWIHSIWFVIGAAVNYMFFYRAGIPAWLEIVKQGMPEKRRHTFFSLSSALAYLEGIALSLAIGGLLDKDPGLWKWLFAASAFLGLIAVWIQSRLPIAKTPEQIQERPPLKELFIRPWRDSFRLIRERKDFALFQWGFMFSGFGIMIIQPVIPIFAADVLGISYLEMATAISIAKGLGFALSSSIWAKRLSKTSILRVTRVVFVCVALFSLSLSFSVWNLAFFYLAYFLYGVGQGGSHLVWNMSGPLFAGKTDSSRYTGVNIVMAGLRGAIAPPLGGLLLPFLGPLPLLIFGSLLNFSSSLALLRGKRAVEKVSA